MIELQRLTGMRPGVVVVLRAGDLDRTEEVWVCRPMEHKTEYHGRGKEVCIGPKAQEVLKDWLKADPHAY